MSALLWTLTSRSTPTADAGPVPPVPVPPVPVPPVPVPPVPVPPPPPDDAPLLDLWLLLQPGIPDMRPRIATMMTRVTAFFIFLSFSSFSFLILPHY
ncbi:MAG: hypothetical protein E3J72_08575 [Planctomycetota bacterium]|nr:MAG: hypothetical protein E3J72_08575 [Planctomycetota bacterium]